MAEWKDVPDISYHEMRTDGRYELHVWRHHSGRWFWSCEEPAAPSRGGWTHGDAKDLREAKGRADAAYRQAVADQGKEHCPTCDRVKGLDGCRVGHPDWADGGVRAGEAFADCRAHAVNWAQRVRAALTTLCVGTKVGDYAALMDTVQRAVQTLRGG